MPSISSQNIRAFIAIPLPESVRHVLAGLQARLKKDRIKASWPNPSSFHLTMKFLGDIPLHLVSDIRQAMLSLEGRYSDIQLTTGSLGVFPGVKKARVIWAGIGGQTDRLETLFHGLEGLLAVSGIQKEKRRYSPHLTLARLKQTPDPEKILRLIMECKDIRSDPFPAGELCLFESRLHANGAVHTKMFGVDL